MKIVIPVIALSALIASGVSAWSGSPSTGNLQIKMTIDKECTVNPTGDAVLDFGTYGTVTNAPSSIERETSIQVQCTSGVPYKIGLNAGLNPKEPGATHLRQLKSAEGNYISYVLRSPEITRTLGGIWGDDFDWTLHHTISERGDLTVGGKGDGTRQSHLVIGSLVTLSGGVFDNNVSAPAGTYTDTVTVTVQF